MMTSSRAPPAAVVEPTAFILAGASLDDTITTTVTVTATVKPSPEIETITWGAPWTTATPYTRTYYDYDRTGGEIRTRVYVSYPQQPSIYWCERCTLEKYKGVVIWIAVGGFILGTLVLALLIWCLRAIRRRKAAKVARVAASEGEGEEDGEGFMERLKYLVAPGSKMKKGPIFLTDDVRTNVSPAAGAGASTA
jgi:hypothetical protein